MAYKFKVFAVLFYMQYIKKIRSRRKSSSWHRRLKSFFRATDESGYVQKIYDPVSGNNQNSCKKITHCIFDLDGTILDTEWIYHKLIKSICSQYGRNYSKELERKCYGGTDHDICEMVIESTQLPMTPRELEDKLHVLLKLHLPSAPLQKGVERLLSHLHDSDVPIALATNSTEQEVRLHVLAKPKLFSLFHHMVTATDPHLTRGKPLPDIYLLAASRFPDQPKPRHCLVFEDSPIGVQAGKAAGMQVVMTPPPNIEREETRKADLVLRSLLDFRPELFGLSPFSDTSGRKFSITNKG